MKLLTKVSSAVRELGDVDADVDVHVDELNAGGEEECLAIKLGGSLLMQVSEKIPSSFSM